MLELDGRGGGGGAPLEREGGAVSVEDVPSVVV